ncbi:MAG: phosphatidylglycerophosphatase A [Candidatus Riflebacteria bacterium]|nr:phosphatidylglycerophosphatase A [Candidatus Riflebacteria bacterium]
MGRLPIGRENIASLLGVVLFFLTRKQDAWMQIVLFTLSILVAIGIAERAEQICREKDADLIVVGETCGMWATLFFFGTISSTTLIIAFILFRLFDHIKFFPLNVFESFRGGLGIIMDDLAAGMLTNFAIRTFIFIGILSGGTV